MVAGVKAQEKFMIRNIQTLMRRVSLTSRAADVNRYRLSQAMIEYQMYMATAIEEGEEQITRRTLKHKKNTCMKVMKKKTAMKSEKKQALAIRLRSSPSNL